MVNGGDRTDVFTEHAGNIARAVDRNSVKWTDKGLRLRADRHAGSTINAGIPSNIE